MNTILWHKQIVPTINTTYSEATLQSTSLRRSLKISKNNLKIFIYFTGFLKLQS